MPTILNPNMIRFQWAMLLLMYMVIPTIWANPTASFAIYSTSKNPPYSVFLSATSSSPWQGENVITKLLWTDSENHHFNSDITTATAYNTAGTYQITLTVWDAAGNSDTVTQSVTVPFGDSPPPPPPPILPTAVFEVVEINGLTVTVDASGSGPGITLYEYEAVRDEQFGIGSRKSYPPVYAPKTSFPLDKAGNYTISLYVTDKVGRNPKSFSISNVNVKEPSKEKEVDDPNLIASFEVIGKTGCEVSVNASGSKPKGQINTYNYNWKEIGGSNESKNFPTENVDGKVDIPLPRPGKYTISLEVIAGSLSAKSPLPDQTVTIGDSCKTTELPIKITFGNNNAPVELDANNTNTQELLIETNIGIHIENTGNVPLTLSEPIINFFPPEVLFTVDKFSENPISIKGESSVEVTLEASKQITEATLGKATLSFDVTNNERTFNITLILEGTVEPPPTDEKSTQPDVNQGSLYGNLI